MTAKKNSSCIYKGIVSHSRHGHAANAFRYSIFMLMLDLDEIDDLFRDYWFWSARGKSVARFRRADHFGDVTQSLAVSIRNLVEERTGKRPEGSIRLLTHLSYFGYCFNPLSVYYCYDTEQNLQDVVLEVSNTPWGEQHCYILGQDDNLSQQGYHYRFDKDFHVSPFLPMEMQYNCRLTDPQDRLYISLDNYREGTRVFGSRLALSRQEINHASMAATLLRDPFMTFKVAALIHWQAIKLWFKKAPLFAHPKKTKKEHMQNG